ncbi:hypothetical protein QYZ43_09025 [Vibrio parahaemolyticus]|nr:hypothetical protein [Vibrio parahaemolyticus]MDN4717748.1 hypothetical protein [Vibrio parahaemolyticus]MDN4721595.1 hypothetical protein [Vibrio parahaemolyticus]
MKFTDVNGSYARYMTSFAQPYMSQSEQAIYLSFDSSLAGFGCGWENDEYLGTFGESDVPKCGNTFVFDAKTLKLVDRGDFTPDSYDCNVWGGKYGDGFYCLGGAAYRSGRPSEKMGNFLLQLICWLSTAVICGSSPLMVEILLACYVNRPTIALLQR